MVIIKGKQGEDMEDDSQKKEIQKLLSMKKCFPIKEYHCGFVLTCQIGKE